MTDLRTELADLIRDLVDPYTVTSPLQLRSAIPDGRPPQVIEVHRATFPSLLDQLRTAVEPSSSTQGGVRGYESKPSASIDAIDAYRQIQTGSVLILGLYGGKFHDDTAANVRALVGLDDPDWRAIVTTVQHWLTTARLVTRWEVPARRLREPCSRCGVRGHIRVGLDPLEALCGKCGQTWTGDAEIAILAQHVRWCNGELETEGAAA